ncbi:MAG: thioredoxin family protein [Bacteroidales bacterium]|nr:thioredoxin family protein [Candidatus Colimorpha pelethequi]
MKKTLAILFGLLMSVSLFAQNDKPYDEQANAMEQINTAVAQANAEGKYVLCQVGGNWCPWCLRFSQMAESDTTIHQIIDQNFVYIHVNFSQKNKNQEAMKRLQNPGRFGFPVFVILDGEGNVIHIQNSEYLEEGKGYSIKKVVDFLFQWTPTSVNTLRE